MPALRYLNILVCVLLLGGCHQGGYLAKRESELKNPTDIRQTIPWCAGEDAIFHGPCGPSKDFYGYKPTYWGVWPASGADWREVFCGPLQGTMPKQPIEMEVSGSTLTPEPNAKATEDLPVPENTIDLNSYEIASKNRATNTLNGQPLRSNMRSHSLLKKNPFR